MEVTLPSGRTATLRDTFLRGDRRAARKALKLVISADGERHMDLSVEDDVTGAILRQMIVRWDVGQPLPREAQTDEMAQAILDTLPDDDYAELAKAVRPFYLKVMSPDGGSGDPNSSSAATGTSTSAAADGQGTLIT